MQWPANRRVIGTKVQRLDGPDKATGRAKYSFDKNLPGMLQARMLRCPHAHARIKSIDTAAAEKTPGFRALHGSPRPATNCFMPGRRSSPSPPTRRSTPRTVCVRSGSNTPFCRTPSRKSMRCGWRTAREPWEVNHSKVR